MHRVLVVEDQPNLLTSLTKGLTEEGYSAVAVETAQAAKHLLSTGPVDAVVLDLMLPDGDGMMLLRELRQSGFNQPVLIVTARDAIEDRIEGLDMGADDYLVKPFSFDELLARLRAVLRRAAPTHGTQLRVGDLELDLLTRRVIRAGVELDLTQRQFELLAYLMRHAGETVTRDMIARDVWKESTATWTNVIEVQINRLRRKIERLQREPMLHTIRGEGYQLGVRQ
jgi:DNA-binding response OmpR family regulator